MASLVRQPLRSVSAALRGQATTDQRETCQRVEEDTDHHATDGSNSSSKSARRRMSVLLSNLGSRSPANLPQDGQEEQGDETEQHFQRRVSYQKLESGPYSPQNHYRTRSNAPIASRLLGDLEAACSSTPVLTLNGNRHTGPASRPDFPSPMSHLERENDLDHQSTDAALDGIKPASVTMVAQTPDMSSPQDGYFRPRPTSSVTFADSRSPRGGKEDARIPYRERKLSESVLSLTEVKEEDEPINTSEDSDTREKPGDAPPTASKAAETKRIVPSRRQSARVASPLPPDEFNSIRNQTGAQAPRAAPHIPFPSSAGSGDLSFDAAAQRLAARRKVAPSFPTSLTPQGQRHSRFSTDMNAMRPQLVTRRTEVTSTAEQKLRQRRFSEFDSAVSEKDRASTNTFPRSDLSSSTPKEQLVLREEGQADVVFQLGNCIGKGQFGSVFRALNLTTGQMVAVKRITLNDRSEEDIAQLMREVDLLKALSHASVVQYEGLVRDHDNASIILEYVENGSLLHTLKAFGNFPEKLVASYVAKILEGLIYLHDMDVVHCDLKAANILSTKNGNIKLSDFGVSLNLKVAQDLKENDAVGTPNWMAPEVIELQGASPASDVWSLGCTIVELLTSKPPYSELNAMSAMFRIVEDDCPPIPPSASESLQEFLGQCFQKDPEQRPRAAELLHHPWLKIARESQKSLRTRESVPTFERITASESASGGAAPNTSLQFSTPKLEIDRADRRLSATDILPKVRRPLEMAAQSPKKRYSQLSASPTPSASIDILSRRNSEVASSNTSFDMLRSPSLMATMEKDRERGLYGTELADISTYDVTTPALVVDDESKQHAFVKSSFSKHIACKVCREAVKKHAVLCEECGLICHASCTRRIATPCSLRGQIRVIPENTASQSPPLSASPSSGGDLSPRFSLLNSPRSPLAKLKRRASKGIKSDAKALSRESPLQRTLSPLSSPSFAQQQRVMPLPTVEGAVQSPRGTLTSYSTGNLLARGDSQNTAARSDGSESSANSVIDHGLRASEEGGAKTPAPLPKLPFPSRFRSRHTSTEAFPSSSRAGSPSLVSVAQEQDASSPLQAKERSRIRLMSLPTDNVFRDAQKEPSLASPSSVVTNMRTRRRSRHLSKNQDCVVM